MSAAKKTKPRNKFTPETLMEGLFAQQLAFVKDPATFKSGCCGRRAGKSWCCAVALYYAAMTTGNSISVYLALTRRSAKNIMWRLLKKIAQKYSLNVEWSESELVAKLVNGSEIWLFGANDETTAENLRGNPYKLVVFDECSSWRGHLENVVDEIIVPAVLDMSGSIALIGTPSADFMSLFYRANNKLQEYSRHHWDVRDNPHLNGAKFIADLKRLKGWDDDNPILLREYFGKWVRSLSDNIYHYNPLRNSYSELPDFHLIKIMGIDLGYNDDDAIEVLGYNPEHTNKIYRVDGFKKNKLSIHDLALKIIEMRDRYQPSEIVMDEGALGKKIGEELRIRYHLPVSAADKAEKLTNIEFLNADLDAGNVLIREDSDLAQEWLNLGWADDSRKKEDPRAANHSSDAFLYAYRKCRPYFYQTPVPAFASNSEDYWRAEEKRMLASYDITDEIDNNPFFDSSANY